MSSSTRRRSDPDGYLPEVEALPSRLNQVFLNLLVNAGQAIDGKGRIVIATGTEGDEAWVAVEDTGCGIPKPHLNRIFEPFSRPSRSGRERG